MKRYILGIMLILCTRLMGCSAISSAEMKVDHIFNDGRSVDEVTDIMQNRAGIYISESKL